MPRVDVSKPAEVVASAASPAPLHDDDGVLVARGVVFGYPAFTLGPVDRTALPGVVHCVIGPNGSGKTTLVNLLLGLLRPVRGEIRLLGEAPVADGRDVYRHVGFSPDADELIPELSAEELWDACAFLHVRFGGSRGDLLANAHELASQLEFSPPAQPIAQYSHGMRKKTQIVAALLHDPAVAILDEPTNGLDPIASYRLGELVRRLADQGSAFLVTCHDLAWAERFSDRVTVLRAGTVAAAGRTPEVLRKTPTDSLLDSFMRALQ